MSAGRTGAARDKGEARVAPNKRKAAGSTRGRPAQPAPGLLASPGAVALRRGVAALAQWLRRPLTSLHLILGVFGLLTLFGLVMVLSASSVESYAADGSSYSVFVKQLMFCALGLVLFWAGLRIPPQKLRMLAAPMLLLGIVLLVAVLIPGIGALRGGSRAWFAFGPFSLQPSEGVKVALTLWGAHVLALRRNVLHRWKHALSPVVPVSLLIFVLLILQPDLGMTVSMGMVLVALLFFAGAPMRLMAALTLGGLAGAVVLGLTAGYRQARIAAFLSPATADPLGPGYQATQALYSLADGGLFGVGLGQGRAKWSYLPNAHNDFIFAIIGEELGFLGAFAVLALFATLAYTGLRIAARTVDPWLRIVVATSTTWLVAQAAINIGYVVGLLPVTGLQLPLISSGGTSLVVTMFIFGVLANAARHEPEAVATLTRGSPARQRDQPRPADPAAAALPGSRRAHTGRRGAGPMTLVRGGGGRGHGRAHRAGHGARRRRPPPAPGRHGHRARHREGPRHPAHPGARLPPGADPARAAAAQAQRRPAAPADEGVVGGVGGPRRAPQGRRGRRGRVRRLRRPARLPRRAGADADRRARGQRAGRAGEQGRGPVRGAGRRRGARQRAAARRGARDPAAPVGHLAGPRGAAPGRPRTFRPAGGRARCCWSSAARRAPARSTRPWPRRCPGWWRRGSGCCTHTGPPGRPRTRAPGYVPPALHRGHAPGLRRRRRGAVPGGGDDRRRGVGRGPARGVRAAAARQRRAGAQRRTGRRGGRRGAGAGRRADRRAGAGRARAAAG